MKFDKVQVQDIEKSIFKEPEARKKPWWFWMLIGLTALILVGLVLILFLTRTRNRFKDKASLLVPAPVVELTPEPVESTASAIRNLRKEWVRARVFLDQIDFQQEKLQPPLINLDLGL